MGPIQWLGVPRGPAQPFLPRFVVGSEPFPFRLVLKIFLLVLVGVAFSFLLTSWHFGPWLVASITLFRSIAVLCRIDNISQKYFSYSH